MSNVGIIQANKSSVSSLYRLVDLVVITLTFFSTLLAFELAPNPNTMILLCASIIVYMLVAEGLELYRSWRTSPLRELLKHVVASWTITSFMVIAGSYALTGYNMLRPTEVLLWLVLTYPALTLWRAGFRQMLTVYRKGGGNSRSALVIGANASGLALANQLRDQEGLGISCIGLFDDRAPQRLPYDVRGQVLGGVDQAIAMARRNEVDYVYIALPMSAEKRIMQVLDKCSDTTATVSIIPNFFIYNLINARWQNIGSIQALSIYDTPFQGASDVLKRLEDVIFSSLILALIAVPMLIIAALVKITSPGPVIFKQDRYGLDGKKIRVYKFRSMTTADNGATVKQATKNDARITPLGAFLRKTSLDELPQFINVLRGEMSIVGPRPHAVAHNEQYRKLIQRYMLRHKVKPGITGWAQINGLRGETETINKMVKRVEYDLEYIHRWSLWFDVKIILSTVVNGFVNKNAY
ncbi:undecaprenyl-phosphate glucose phosphotransferase [Alteromonas oceanisediminis]|uniref:undecaprenyl-phosphate glucose phosphotransferase n=1 Tax=Alteromonas oceanisediminis TaxID=2836180 RepID=UPI001BDAFC97|nr:undecaprenyl-phosphate glucose phosphotransferase [Alteromonas oceanisediminis]MBT0587620.1 undecaprenyl-phosphate glucose phosphotransferase [Alteromonas oceanisediminis]